MRFVVQKPGSSLPKIDPSLGVVTYEEYGFAPLSAYLKHLGKPQTNASMGTLPRSERFRDLGEVPNAIAALPAKMVRSWLDPEALSRHLSNAIELVASWGKTTVVIDLSPCEDEPHVLLAVGMMAATCTADVEVRFQFTEHRKRLDDDDE